LYTYYLINEETKLSIEHSKVRYLQFEHNTDQLHKFTNLLILVFGNKNNYQINFLPKTLITVIFGFRFDKKIKQGVLPNSLQFLTFGDDFNQEIKPNVLPNLLQFIKINKKYKYFIELQNYAEKNNFIIQ
jgi:hypothetical protein